VNICNSFSREPVT